MSEQPFAQREFLASLRPHLADSTQWGARRIAAIEKFVVSANVGFLEQGHTHPIGHNQPLKTSSFSGPSRLSFGVGIIEVVIRTPRSHIPRWMLDSEGIMSG